MKLQLLRSLVNRVNLYLSICQENGFDRKKDKEQLSHYLHDIGVCLHFQDDPLLKYVDILYKVVPPILMEHGKAKNPWPNVDAQSGIIQWHYGVREYDFYTVLFGIGRAIGICANIIWDRALMYPLERPKSLTTDMLEKLAGIDKK